MHRLAYKIIGNQSSAIYSFCRKWSSHICSETLQAAQSQVFRPYKLFSFFWRYKNIIFNMLLPTVGRLPITKRNRPQTDEVSGFKVRSETFRLRSITFKSSISFWSWADSSPISDRASDSVGSIVCFRLSKLALELIDSWWPYDDSMMTWRWPCDGRMMFLW